MAPELRALQGSAGVGGLNNALDHHLAVDRAGDLDATVAKARRWQCQPGRPVDLRARSTRLLAKEADINPALTRRSGLPGRVIADPLGLRNEVGQGAAVELGLVQGAALEQLAPGRLEVAVKGREELEGWTWSGALCVTTRQTLVREDLLVRALDLGRDLDSTSAERRDASRRTLTPAGSDIVSVRLARQASSTGCARCRGYRIGVTDWACR